jgi:hypothetical protein
MISIGRGIATMKDRASGVEQMDKRKMGMGMRIKG